MPDLSLMLLQNLLESYAGQGQRDPFSPTSAVASPEDANQVMSPASEQWAKDFAGHLGVDPAEMMKPASGPIAQQLGVEGVMPDYDAMRKAMLNIAKGHEALAQQGGPEAALMGHVGAAAGPAPENPALRGALGYQALQQAGPRIGGLGGQLIASLSPLMAGQLMGPYLEQQQRATQQAAQLKAQLAIADAASKGALRKAQTLKTMADIQMEQAKMLQLGDKKYQIKGNPSTGGFIFDPSTGDYKQIDPVPKQGIPLKPITHLDEKGRKWNDYYQNPADFYAGKPPDKSELVGQPGSATEREKLVTAAQLAQKALDTIPDLYKRAGPGATGPMIGSALDNEKASNKNSAVSQWAGKVYSDTMLTKDQKDAAIELMQQVNILNDSVNKVFTGVAYGKDEYAQRQLSMGSMHDYGQVFEKNIKGTGNYFRDAIQLYKDKFGYDLLNPSGPVEIKPPMSGGFKGAPSTNRQQSQGVLLDQSVEQAQKQFGY